MKTYVGTYDPRGCQVMVEVLKNQGFGKPAEYPLKHEARHSPDGFSWGYGGSGPSELARCILLDHFGFLDPPVREERVEPVYQDFKFAVISTLNMTTDFKLTSQQIDRWLAARGQKA